LQAVQQLQKVPGIGPVIAATLVSRLSARSFSHSDQFVAYCGLDVRVRQSGKKSGQLGLSKQGEAELRRLLYLAAQASLRAKDSPFKAQYERERAKGLSSTAALCAVARKIARLSWSLVTHGSSYDPDRVYKQN
jgi:transposase